MSLVLDDTIKPEMSDHTERVRLAERDYESALDRLRELGCEPNIYRMSANVAPLLDVLQGGVETYEGFPLDTEHMKLLVGTINDIRVEIGHDPEPIPLRRNGELV